MDQMLQVQSEWYSPRRLHDSPKQYDFPGDRFIPNRSLMNLDQAHGLLTNRTSPVPGRKVNEAYQKRLNDSLYSELEGRPFRMLVFRGSPKCERKSFRAIDEMQKTDLNALKESFNQTQPRSFPKSASRILDAPGLKDDYYSDILDWGTNNVIAVALGMSLYLWSSENSSVKKLFQTRQVAYPTSVAWSPDAKTLAVGFANSEVELWDPITSKCIRRLESDTGGRIGTLSWNGGTLTAGSNKGFIMNHDVRTKKVPILRIRAHKEAVCGLKWSPGGNLLASGGNENVINIYEASKMKMNKCLHKFKEHRAAVKALAWCPHEYNVLASGGGSYDGCIKFWNVQKGTCIGNISTKSQICGLEWNRHHKEILSGHGYGMGELQNRMCLWKYPSKTKVGELKSQGSRVLNLSQSPNGLTVVSAEANETLWFWDVFGPPKKEASNMSELDSYLSFKAFPIR